jgi:hypothetical protein
MAPVSLIALSFSRAMFDSPWESLLKPSVISRWCKSVSAGGATPGALISIPTQATGSNIHAAKTVTMPGLAST